MPRHIVVGGILGTLGIPWLQSSCTWRLAPHNDFYQLLPPFGSRVACERKGIASHHGTSAMLLLPRTGIGTLDVGDVGVWESWQITSGTMYGTTAHQTVGFLFSLGMKKIPKASAMPFRLVVLGIRR